MSKFKLYLSLILASGSLAQAMSHELAEFEDRIELFSAGYLDNDAAFLAKSFWKLKAEERQIAALKMKELGTSLPGINLDRIISGDVSRNGSPQKKQKTKFEEAKFKHNTQANLYMPAITTENTSQGPRLRAFNTQLKEYAQLPYDLALTELNEAYLALDEADKKEALSLLRAYNLALPAAVNTQSNLTAATAGLSNFSFASNNQDVKSSSSNSSSNSGSLKNQSSSNTGNSNNTNSSKHTGSSNGSASASNSGSASSSSSSSSVNLESNSLRQYREKLAKYSSVKDITNTSELASSFYDLDEDDQEKALVLLKEFCITIPGVNLLEEEEEEVRLNRMKPTTTSSIKGKEKAEDYEAEDEESLKVEICQTPEFGALEEMPDEYFEELVNTQSNSASKRGNNNTNNTEAKESAQLKAFKDNLLTYKQNPNTIDVNYLINQYLELEQADQESAYLCIATLNVSVPGIYEATANRQSSQQSSGLEFQGPDLDLGEFGFNPNIVPMDTEPTLNNNVKLESDELASQLESELSKLDEYTRENNILEAQLQKLNQDTPDLTVENIRMSQENKRLKASIAALRRTIGKLEQDLKKAMSSSSARDARSQGLLVSSNNSLRAQIQLMKIEKEKEQQAIERLQKYLNSL